MDKSKDRDVSRHFGLGEALSFLESGAFMQWSDNSWMLSWGNPPDDVDKGHFSLFLSDFYLEKPLTTSFSRHREIFFEDLISVFQQLDETQIEATRAPANRVWNSPGKEDFRKNFEKIKTFIEGGEIQKAVPVVFETSNNSISLREKRDILISLLKDKSKGHSYGYWDSGNGFIGKTPELLFEGRGNKFNTMALAGTAKKEVSLLDDAKEMHEHKLVVEDILNQLNSSRKGKTYEWNSRILKHLRTDIDFDWSGTFKELVKKLHPTPALGLSPRSKDLEQLKFLSPSLDRNFFGAPFGFLHADHFKCVVSIRQIQWFDDQTHLGSGCGIVKESDFDKEWGELQLKRNSVKEMLSL